MHSGVTAVNNWISTNIGDSKTFFQSCMHTQNSDYDLFSMSYNEQKNIMDNSLSLQSINILIDIFKDSKINYKKKLCFSKRKAIFENGLKLTIDLSNNKSICAYKSKTNTPLLEFSKNKFHKNELKNNNFENIDLVIVNFYPFEKTLEITNNKNKIIENIDIGGPAMVRAAAKNFNDVTVITSTKQYPELINQLEKNNILPEEISKFWLHQANGKMIKLITSKILNTDEFDERITPMPITEFGNLASVGSLFAFNLNNDLSKGQKGVICSFGAGYSVCSIIVEKN